MRDEFILNWDSVPVYVDRAYVCRIFAVTPNTVGNWVKRGILKQHNIAGTVRYAKEDLMKLGG